jgi:hypothetical protein
MESAVVSQILDAISRNGQRCIHFITAMLAAMSNAEFGA